MSAATEASPVQNLLADLRSGPWLEQQVFPPLRWVLPGLLPEGMSLLIGGPKIGKSALSLDVALAVASGGKALGELATGHPRPVLLLALEDGDRRLQGRARRLLNGDPFPHLLQYLTKVQHGQAIATMRAWLETLEVGADPLVILDTLGTVMPARSGNDSAYTADYRMMNTLKSVCDERPGMALLILHHDRNAESADFVDGVSGTNGIAGAADSILMLTRARIDSRGLLRVTGRDVVEAEYEVHQTADGFWHLAGAGLEAAAAAAETARKTANLGNTSAEIVRWVEQQPEPVRAADVAAALGQEQDTVKRYLSRLADSGRLLKEGRGLYGRVPSVPSVPSTSEDRTEEGRDTWDGRDTDCEETAGLATDGLKIKTSARNPEQHEAVLRYVADRTTGRIPARRREVTADDVAVAVNIEKRKVQTILGGYVEEPKYLRRVRRGLFAAEPLLTRVVQ